MPKYPKQNISILFSFLSVECVIQICACHCNTYHDWLFNLFLFSFCVYLYPYVVGGKYLHSNLASFVLDTMHARLGSMCL